MSAGYFDSVFGDAGAWERACDAIKARDSVRSTVTAPGAVTSDGRIPPCVGHAVYSDRYPAPAEAELVTLWKKDRRVVMSVTANGQTQDFYMPPARLVYLLREVAEQLAENTLIQ